MCTRCDCSKDHPPYIKCSIYLIKSRIQSIQENPSGFQENDSFRIPSLEIPSLRQTLSHKGSPFSNMYYPHPRTSVNYITIYTFTIYIFTIYTYSAMPIRCSIHLDALGEYHSVLRRHPTLSHHHYVGVCHQRGSAPYD